MFLFFAFAEVATIVGVVGTSGAVRVALTSFVIAFPTLVAAAFFLLLFFRAPVIYAPSDPRSAEDAAKFMAASRETFAQVTASTSDARAKVKQIEVHGNPDQFKLLFKAQSPTWMKSTKAMQVLGGCVVQVTSEHAVAGGGVNAAEALVFVPGVVVKGSGSKEEGSFLAPADEVTDPGRASGA
jgi:hypothetical protein